MFSGSGDLNSFQPSAPDSEPYSSRSARSANSMVPLEDLFEQLMASAERDPVYAYVPFSIKNKFKRNI